MTSVIVFQHLSWSLTLERLEDRICDTKFRAEPRGPCGPHIPPAGVYSGLRRPVLSLRDQGAAPPLRLGVLALPGDGGHLTDFVANLWSIGAIDTTHKTQRSKPLVLKAPARPPEGRASY